MRKLYRAPGTWAGPLVGFIYLSDKQRHLICEPYSVENLHAMAEDLGIKRCWFHGGKHPHYDIPKLRVEEIAKKTMVVSPRTILGVINGTMHVYD